MANGMTGLYVGSSGLRSAQTALNTTAHNLANVNVKGYTRQQVALSSAEYFKIGQTITQDKSYGVGVDTLAIRRVRDDLIDAAYRQENGRLGYYSTQYDAVVEIESLFGELNGVTFEDSLKDLKNAINELSYEPESTIKRSALIQMSTTFIDRAGSIYKGLKDYQTTLNTKVSNTVDRINELGETISSLNKKITQVELSGERANDLRDQRDKALDELSAYAKVTYQETDNKTLLVTLEGFSFVTSFGVNKMGTEDIDGTGLLRPVWEAFNNRAVFNDFEEITAINNNDIGELKGLLLARGNTTADYTDVPVRPEAKDYAGGDTDPQYLADYAQYEKDAEYYNKYIEPSVILSTMAGFDKLVNGIVTSLNDILCPQTTYDSATSLHILIITAIQKRFRAAKRLLMRMVPRLTGIRYLIRKSQALAWMTTRRWEQSFFRVRIQNVTLRLMLTVKICMCSIRRTSSEVSLIIHLATLRLIRLQHSIRNLFRCPRRMTAVRTWTRRWNSLRHGMSSLQQLVRLSMPRKILCHSMTV